MLGSLRFPVRTVLALLLAIPLYPGSSGIAHATPPRYKCIILDGAYEANGINNLGEVVGRTARYGDPGQAFYYKGGQMTPFGASSDFSAAYAISDSGHIAGVTEVGGVERAMMSDRDGNDSAMEDGGAASAEAYSINNQIEAVGFVDGDDGWNRATRWDAGSYDDISGGQGRNSGAYGINNNGEIVGYDQNVAAFFDPLPHPMGAPGPRSAARSIADSGFVAGTTFVNSSTWSAWFYDGSSFQTIASGPPQSTYAWDVNNLGQVVGEANGEAFLWEDGNYYPLSSLIGDGAGTLYEARSINDCGVIVGYALEGAFLMVPIDSTDTTDTDGDGLLDRWERCGLDLDMDGVPEFFPPDADPEHADLYVEMDHAASAPIQPEVHDALVAAFAAVPSSDLPVPNPDGAPGITLHLLVDDGDVLETGDLDLGAAPYRFPEVFDLIKEDNFGTDAERADPARQKILEAKRHVYHYGVQIRGLRAQMADTTIDYVSGIAECEGNDFMTATRAFRYPPGSWHDQAGTLMHELGHNLGLLHGGNDDVNFKANYFSVMNYAWQMPQPGTSLEWFLDYSHSASNLTIYEASLDEPDGFRGATRDGNVMPVFFAVNGDPGRVALAWTNTTPIDFDGDGVIDTRPVIEDINHVDASDAASPSQRHYDHDDWADIRLEFRSFPSFPDGVHTLCTGAGSLELSRRLIETLAAVPPPPAAGIGPTKEDDAQGPNPLAGSSRGSVIVLPNPSNDVSRIRFALPAAGPVTVTLFDAGGRALRTLIDGPRSAGPLEIEWDGRDDSGQAVADGLYFVQVRCGGEVMTGRVLRRR